VKLTRQFPHDPRSVTQARRFVTQSLEELPPDLRDAVEMMVSELATNCVLHTESDFTVDLEQVDDELHVEVSDNGRGRPVLRPPDPTSISGRGLRTVELLSDAWGVRPHGDAPGKTVWFRVTLSEVAQEA
jgi:anti-sigma regulatory factor (Ser/Thr protein kinase)